VAANLKGRLARIRGLGLIKAAELGDAAPKSKSPRKLERPSFLNSWERVGDLAWTRTLRYESPLKASLDPSVFAPLRRGRRNAPAGAAVTRYPPERIQAERLRFFDLETTGLSGGTGTLAFLAAVGRIEGSSFELTQLFLEDFPGEGPFIGALLKLFGEGDVMVSYNGRAFDMPLLRTRCVMNAISPPEIAHLDALFAARRLWKRVHGGASLGLLEREVLGIEREEDLPGAMIPEAWLDFARTGDNPLMRLVLSHNADDVVGLARLVARLQSIFDDPRSRLARSDVDRAGLGRSLLGIGRPEVGEELLEAALGEGDEGAGLLLMRRYRIASRVEDCIRIESLMPSTFRSAVERAKLFERTAHDLEKAAFFAREALRLAPGEAEREAAARRLLRIERRTAQGA
jgi:uncharacterized protein